MRLLLVLVGMSASGAPPEFKNLWSVLEKAQCRNCHNDNGVGSTTRLQFPRDDAPENEIREFGLWLRTFVVKGNQAGSLLWQKPTARVSHGGGERIRQGSSDEATLREWVTYLATLADSAIPRRAAATGPSKPVLRRLTHSQYNHTVRDLLGVDTHPADQFPKEDYVQGFTNQAGGQSVSPLQAEAYAIAADRLSRNAGNLVKCSPSDACRRQFIEQFGRRAFRRPLTAEEAARYEKLFAASGGFPSGANTVVNAMLRSPNFLFHLEPGQYAIASRLSYFLWDTMPDEVLLTAAEKGELGTSTGIERQVKRMLSDDRSRPALDEFLAQWLRFDRLRGALRDRRLFPEYSAELVNALVEETSRLFRSLVWGGGNFMEFLSADYAYLSPELARLYGVEAPSELWGKVKFGNGYPRAGILGQGSFLTLTSKPEETSPTERGLFIREHFLCQQVPPPPPGVNATLPPVTDEKPITQRERLQAHLSNPVCAGCHQLVDPIGFGFEKFDAIGRYREQELLVVYPTADDLKTRRKTKPSEYRLPVEAKGSVRGIRNSDFTSPAELGRILAADPICQKCVVKQLFRYALGRADGADDQPVIEKALARFRQSQFQFTELIMAIAVSEPFQTIEGGSRATAAITRPVAPPDAARDRSRR